ETGGAAPDHEHVVLVSRAHSIHLLATESVASAAGAHLRAAPPTPGHVAPLMTTTSICEGENAKYQAFACAKVPRRRAEARVRPGVRADGAARDRQGSGATGSEGGPPCVRSVVHALPAQNPCVGRSLRARRPRGRGCRARSLHQGVPGTASLSRR